MLSWDISKLSREIAARILNRATGDQKTKFGQTLLRDVHGTICWHTPGVYPHIHVTEDYEVKSDDVVLIVLPSGGAIDIQLPPVASMNAQFIYVKRGPGDLVTILPYGTEEIDLGSSYVLSNSLDAVTLYGEVHYGWGIMSEYP